MKKHIAKLKKQMDGIDRTIEKIDGISSSLSAGKNIEKDAEKDAEKGEEKGTRVSVKEKLSQMRAKSQQQKVPETSKAKSKEECL